MSTSREKHHGKILKQHIQDKNINLSILAPFIGKDRATIQRWYAKSSIARNNIILLCYALELTPAHFYNSEEEIKAFQPPKSLKPAPLHEENTLFVKFTNGPDLIEGESNFQHYFDLMRKRIDHVRNKISIYEYLDLTYSPKLQGHQTFISETKKYLKQIEDLSAKNIVYRRLFALPINFEKNDRIMQLLSPEMSAMDNSSRDLICLMRLLFPLSIQHLVCSFKLFGDKMELYLAHATVKKYSFMVVDLSSILFQTVRYSLTDQTPHPDTLLLQTHTQSHPDEAIEVMIKTYDHTFESLISLSYQRNSPIRRISFDQLKNGMFLFDQIVRTSIVHYKLALEIYSTPKEYDDSASIPPHQKIDWEKVEETTHCIEDLKKIQSNINEKLAYFKSADQT